MKRRTFLQSLAAPCVAPKLIEQLAKPTLIGTPAIMPPPPVTGYEVVSYGLNDAVHLTDEGHALFGRSSAELIASSSVHAMSTCPSPWRCEIIHEYELMPWADA